MKKTGHIVSLIDENDVRGAISRLQMAIEEQYYWAKDVVLFVANLIKKFDEKPTITAEEFKEFLVKELGFDPDDTHSIDTDFWEDFWNKK